MSKYKLETSCTTPEGLSCRFIPQKRLKHVVCNNTGKHQQRITAEFTPALSGRTLSSIGNGGQKELPVPMELLSRGECDEEQLTFQINNYKQLALPLRSRRQNFRLAMP